MAAYNSNVGGFFRFLLMIYAVVLLIDVVLLLVLRGVQGNLIQSIYGADMPSSYKGKVHKRWTRVEAQMQSGQEIQYKLAILEADTIVDEVLAIAKLEGENMMERLDKALPYQVEHKEHLLWAHSIRNNIVRDNAFAVDKELAEKTIGAYREFLRSWETL